MSHSAEEGEKGIDFLLSEIREIEDTIRHTPPPSGQRQQQNARASGEATPRAECPATPRDGGVSSNRTPSRTVSPASRRQEATSAGEGKGSPPSTSAASTPRRGTNARVPHFALPTQASLASFSPNASPHRPVRTPRGLAAASSSADESRGHEEEKGGQVSGAGTSGGARSSARSRGHDLQLMEMQDTIAKMKEEARLMRSEMKRKESALLETTRELEGLKKRNMMLNTALSSHRAEVRELRAEKTALESLSLQSESIDELKTKGVGTSGCTSRERRSHNARRLERENNFLLAAVNRYDAALVSLKEVISVMVTQKTKLSSEIGGSRGKMNDPVQDKLREVLDSLMRVKEEQILPPQPTDADSDSSQGSGDDLAEGGDASHDQNNKRARQVRSWVDECKKLRGNNKRLSQTVAQHEKTIKSQHLRITSLTDKLEALGSSIRESKQRRWVLSAKAPTGQGAANRHHAGKDGDVAGGSEEDVPRSGPSTGASVGGTDEPGGQVPLEVYEHMEREAMLLRTELRDKEVAVQERAEVVEHLERKLHVMTHSKDSEIRKIRREAAAAVAGYGIKVSLGGADLKETPRRVPSGGVPKKGSPPAASARRNSGETGYSNSSIGSFNQRQSSLLPSARLGRMSESNKAAVVGSDVHVMASHASSSIELGDTGIGHELDAAQEHGDDADGSPSVGDEGLLGSYKIFDDVGFLEQANDSATMWQ